MKGFVAYSKADAAEVADLMIHLKGLEYEGIIQPWHDGQLVPGDGWESRIHSDFAEADIIIVCVSADLLATDYFQRMEIPTALGRHARGEATVIPVIFRTCSWKDHRLGRIKGIPAKGKTVQDYDNTDEVWTDVAAAVRSAVRVRTRIVVKSNLTRSADEGRKKLLRYCMENNVYATGKPLVRQVCVDDTRLGDLLQNDNEAGTKKAVLITSLKEVGVDAAHAEAIAHVTFPSRIVQPQMVTVRQLQCKHNVSGTPYSTKVDGEGIGATVGWRDDIENNLDRLPYCRKCFRAAGVEKGRVVQWLRRRDWKWLAAMIVGLAGL